jgi:hypothetical protein
MSVRANTGSDPPELPVHFYSVARPVEDSALTLETALDARLRIMRSPIHSKPTILILLLIAFSGTLGWALSLFAKGTDFWSLILFGIVVIAIAVPAVCEYERRQRR